MLLQRQNSGSQNVGRPLDVNRPLLGHKNLQPLVHDFKGQIRESSYEVVDVQDPSANVELTELEVQEIMSRPNMNPDHGRVGYKPNSNLNYYQDQTLID